MAVRAASSFRTVVLSGLALGGVVVGLPGAAQAVSNVVFAPMTQTSARFTPAKVDPELAEKVARRYASSHRSMRFTPANGKTLEERTITVAVRVDDQTSRAVSVRSAIEAAGAASGRGNPARIASSEFDLRMARGLQSFAKPAVETPPGVADISMPDLSYYQPERKRDDKPGRFQTRIALDQQRAAGRAPRTLEGLGEQSVDVSGSYRVVGNLNVTAGVRLSQERDRLMPLTDGVDDSQSVYIGTQLRF